MGGRDRTGSGSSSRGCVNASRLRRLTAQRQGDRRGRSRYRRVQGRPDRVTTRRTARRDAVTRRPRSPPGVQATNGPPHWRGAARTGCGSATRPDCEELSACRATRPRSAAAHSVPDGTRLASSCGWVDQRTGEVTGRAVDAAIHCPASKCTNTIWPSTATPLAVARVTRASLLSTCCQPSGNGPREDSVRPSVWESPTFAPTAHSIAVIEEGASVKVWDSSRQQGCC